MPIRNTTPITSAVNAYPLYVPPWRNFSDGGTWWLTSSRIVAQNSDKKPK